MTEQFAEGYPGLRDAPKVLRLYCWAICGVVSRVILDATSQYYASSRKRAVGLQARRASFEVTLVLQARRACE